MHEQSFRGSGAGGAISVPYGVTHGNSDEAAGEFEINELSRTMVAEERVGIESMLVSASTVMLFFVGLIVGWVVYP
jgi:hypothetical protein